jgi:hypothetical protein
MTSAGKSARGLEYASSKQAKQILYRQCAQFCLSLPIYAYLVIFFQEIAIIYSKELTIFLLSVYANILNLSYFYEIFTTSNTPAAIFPVYVLVKELEVRVSFIKDDVCKN